MSREVGNAAHSVALNLDVGAQHLTDERLQASKGDDQKLVISFDVLAHRAVGGRCVPLTARLPRAALAAR